LALHQKQSLPISLHLVDVSDGKKKFTSDSLELENKRGNFSKDAQKK